VDDRAGDARRGDDARDPTDGGHAGPPPGLSSFRPRDQEDLAPPGDRARIAGNHAAAELVAVLGREGRPATPDEQATLVHWSLHRRMNELAAPPPLSPLPISSSLVTPTVDVRTPGQPVAPPRPRSSAPVR
jgi:hypothetical protein